MHPNKTTTYKLLNDITFMNGEEVMWEKIKAEFVIKYIRAEMGGDEGIHRLEDYGS